MAGQAHTDPKDKNFRQDLQDDMDKNNDRLKVACGSYLG
jgi:hypothetical protein